MINKIISKVEKSQKCNILPKIKIGDIIVVELLVIENNKKRVQSFNGIVISIRKKGFNSSFTVLRNNPQCYVERVFPFNSPLIKNITIKNHIKVRKSKLYYLKYNYIKKR
ncbi:MAG: 50S ribosomal protein L19 [Enterobacteriaceae bacterium]